MHKLARVLVLGVLCCTGARVDAQTLSTTHRVFVEVPLGPDWDDAISDSTRVPGPTWRSGVGFGFDFGRSGVEFGVSVPMWHVRTFPARRFRYVGPSFGWEQQGHSYEALETARRRSIDVAALYRANVPIGRRVTFSWLIGGAWVYRPEQFSSVTSEVLSDGRLVEANRNESQSLRNYLAAVARLDAEFRLGATVSVVPRLRVTAYPSLLDDSGLAPRILVARPEVALRWSF